MDQNTVDNIIANAALLMNDERFNAIVEAKSMSTHRRAKANGGKLEAGGGGGMSSDLALFESQAGFGGGGSRTSAGQHLIPKVQTQQRKSNLPPEIQESFKKMPPLSGGEIGVPSSYTQSRSVIQEQQYAPQPQYQTQAPAAPASIDYNYIKYLVNECIKENMNQLNESASLSGIKLVGGGKIQFTDSKGNVFEGVLKRVK